MILLETDNLGTYCADRMGGESGMHAAQVSYRTLGTLSFRR